MKFILGTKKRMTQLFDEAGNAQPVTVVEAGPCRVTQVKTEKRDEYSAVQIGYGDVKKPSKPLKGHLKDLESFRHLREFRVSKDESFDRGQTIDVNVFKPGDLIDVVGISKGKGFQGVVKRHGFHGSPASHGHKDQLRMPGSIGSTEPARVFKGTKMAGRMGGKQSTTKNLKVVDVDPKTNTLILLGAVPGAINGLLLIRGEGEIVVESDTGGKEEKTEKKKKDNG